MFLHLNSSSWNTHKI